MSRSWEELCAIAREAVSATDEGRWIVGDVACELVTSYRHRTLKEFAAEIGLRQSTAYEYRDMAEFYEDSARRKIATEYPNLTYSHLRAARKLGSIEGALMILEEASRQEWSADALSQEIKFLRGEGGKIKLMAGWDGVVEAAPFTQLGKLVIEVPVEEREGLRAAVQGGVVVRVKVYDPTPEGDGDGL